MTLFTLLKKLIEWNHDISAQTCKGCKYLVYTEKGHWCILTGDNCSDNHQPLNNKCYDKK